MVPDYSFWYIWTVFWRVSSCHTWLEDVLFWDLFGTVGYSCRFLDSHLHLMTRTPWCGIDKSKGNWTWCGWISFPGADPGWRMLLTGFQTWFSSKVFLMPSETAFCVCGGGVYIFINLQAWIQDFWSRLQTRPSARSAVWIFASPLAFVLTTAKKMEFLGSRERQGPQSTSDFRWWVSEPRPGRSVKEVTSIDTA